jgi:hypothetical protein
MRKDEKEDMKAIEIESKIFENRIKMLYYKVVGLRMDYELSEKEVNICFGDDDSMMFVYGMAYSSEIKAEDVKQFIKDMVKLLTENNSKDISKLNPDNVGEKE